MYEYSPHWYRNFIVYELHSLLKLTINIYQYYQYDIFVQLNVNNLLEKVVSSTARWYEFLHCYLWNAYEYLKGNKKEHLRYEFDKILDFFNTINHKFHEIKGEMHIFWKCLNMNILKQLWRRLISKIWCSNINMLFTNNFLILSSVQYSINSIILIIIRL